MIRFLIFLLLLIPVAMAGNWLLQNPGEVHVLWLGYDATIHTAIIALALVLIGVFVAFIAVLTWQLLTWPERRRARRRYRTLAKGITQLTRGVTALALGDESAAHAALKKAVLLLPSEPLPQLLTAQLLQRQGKSEDARVHLRALMNHELTAELATRRLIEQHIAAREWSSATTLAEEALKLNPKDRWLALTLIDLSARDGDTKRMLSLTEGWQWQSPLSKTERHHYAALAHYLIAQNQSDLRLKTHALRHATSYAPDFLPATIAYAELLIAEGNKRRARKWLREAWVKQPSPILVAPILATMTLESPRTQARLLKPFISGAASTSHQLLIAQQAINVGEPARAKSALEAALERAESKAAAALMAEVMKDLEGNEAANIWLARAMDAPAGESWICVNCGAAHAQWAAHCGSCGAFDSMRYERPEARITSVELATTGA